MLNKFMTIALEEAKEVKKDIPVAALIVKDNKIISLATNKREENNQPYKLIFPVKKIL